MPIQCRNCGEPAGRLVREDWVSVCEHCDGLLWLKPLDVVTCRVTRITNFGITVELGDGVEGLIHISELSDRPLASPHDLLALDDQISAKVLRVDVPQKRIGLSFKRVGD